MFKSIKIFVQFLGYWKLASIILNDSIPLTGNVDISRPLGTPFIYNQPIEFSNGTTKLRFEDIQVSLYIMYKINKIYYILFKYIK